MNQPGKNKTRSGAESQVFIYLVDDEVLLLDVAEAILKNGGYVVKKFTDPEAAWKSFNKEKERPRLLITDYAMGKMNGLELIAKCKETEPKLKTLMVSGTAGAEIVINAPVRVDRFLGKPFSPATLLNLVEQLVRDPDL